jgi:hypothetical protein
VGHRHVLHPAPTLRTFFVKVISLLRDRYGAWRKTRVLLPTQAGWQANPEWRSVTARTHPAFERAIGLAVSLRSRHDGRNVDRNPDGAPRVSRDLGGRADF